jgi:hypothetical protein
MVIFSEHVRSEPGEARVMLCCCNILLELDSETGACVIDVIESGVKRLFMGSGSSSLSGACETNFSSSSAVSCTVFGRAEGIEKGKKDVSVDDNVGSGSCCLFSPCAEFRSSLARKVSACQIAIYIYERLT